MITINNIKWPYGHFKYYDDLAKAIVTEIRKLNVEVKCKTENGEIKFINVVSNLLFQSKTFNKVMLKPTHSRYVAGEKEFLKTKRPTEKQYHGVFNAIHSVLDQLKLEADVTVFDARTGNNNILRVSTGRVNNYPVPKTFPVE